MIEICRNYQALTIAVSQLLILDCKIRDEHNEYTLQVPTQHPFITILNQEKLSWRSVLNQMKLIMHHYDKQYVFLYFIIKLKEYSLKIQKNTIAGNTINKNYGMFVHYIS